ncbi:MAG: DNA internalization-related competence protein ComEC/Rec2, partial [Candidatus Omnitrophica bacterium]|nr:DNA internalization-related competence protein ComEC/Rec2 [Candidatus Omnitrophota bacterium]
MKRPLLGIAFAFSLGILLGKIVECPLFYVFGCTVILVFLSILFIKSETRFLAAAFLGFFLLGALALKSYDAIPKNHIKNIVQIGENSSEQILVQGRILDKPDKTKTHYNKDRQRFLLALKAIKTGGDWQPSSGILSVKVFNRMPDLQYGNEIIMEGRLFLPRGATNPGQFDYRKFLERKKIFYDLNAKDRDFVKIIGRGFRNPITVFAYAAKEKIKARIDKFIPAKEALILKAILLGERQEVDEEIRDTFIKTGTVHILSISGLHVGLLVFIFMLLFKLARIPFKIQVFILTFLVIAYCMMVGNRPPIIRSTIMILVFLFGRLLKREQDLLNSLAFSALAILFFRPQQLFDIGFQLSFLTVGSIVYFTPHLERVLIKKRDIIREKRNLYFLRAVSVSFCAWLGSALLVARYFNIVSPVTVIANLLVIPLIFFILAVSLTFLVFGVFSSTLALIFSQTCTLSIQILLKIIAMFSQFPFAYFRVKSPAWFFIIGFYVVLLFFLNRKHFRIKAKYFLIAGLVFINCFVWRDILFKRGDLLKITFLDVGKGDAFVVQFPKGGTMLIDGGEGYGVDMGRLVVSRFLSSEGIDRIDMVVATHPHTDHIGGLATILKNFKVRYFVENGEK